MLGHFTTVVVAAGFVLLGRRRVGATLSFSGGGGSCTGGGGGTIIVIEDFAHPTHTWVAKNDPVMGGKSYSSVVIEDGVGIFDGAVVNVPFLDAPGFITMETRNSGLFPDVSSCCGIEMMLRAKTSYSGYRVSFGHAHVPGNRFAFGYKSNFALKKQEDYTSVMVPFHNFTVRWDDATGDPIVTCAENPDFCPDTSTLQNMKSFTFWGEGVAGKVHLEVQMIQAVGCASSIQTEHDDEDSVVTQTPTAAEATTDNDADSSQDVDSHCHFCLLLVAILGVGVVMIGWHRSQSSAASTTAQYDQIHDVEKMVG